MSSMLGICCSRRVLGNCDVLLREALEGAREEGARTVYLRLADLGLKPCRGCLACVFKGKCSIPNDGLGKLLEHILEADGLIVAAPTYIFGPAGIVKMAIDRSLCLAPFLEEIAKRERFAVSINVAGNSSWNYLGSELTNLFALSFGYQVIDYMTAYAPAPGEVLLDPQNIHQARRAGKTVALALAGKVQKRPLDEQQCPNCYSKVFRLEAGKLICCICGSSATVGDESRLSLKFDPVGEHGYFFTPAHRRFHLDDWIIPTKDRFLARREEIKKLLEKYKE
jgi:multimeric flavodoxin WrbA